jgi:hypothetical protein
VVFSILRDSKCAECGQELHRGHWLMLDEKKRALCLACADLDHLVYLPSGDAALTRRARKHSKLSVPVVRFSRARRRYERQGVLVEDAALSRAEEECIADADVRAERRKLRAAVVARADQEFAASMAEAILRLFPSCPSEQAGLIAAHTAVRGSGRVGRSAAGHALDPDALTLAVVASIRHGHTRYDELLMEGWSREDARRAVHGEVEKAVDRWRRPPGPG